MLEENNKFPKKTTEMSTQELFSYFKKGIVSMVEEHFNHHGKQELEPAVFVGVRRNALMKHEKFKQSLPDELKEQIIGSLEEDRSIHTLCLPLGPFFSDKGSQIMNQFGKELARKVVDDAIQDLKKIDLNAVMFIVFVTEAFMVEQTTKGTDLANDLATGKKTVEDVARESIPPGGVKDMPDAKERLVLMFETLTSSQLVAFDILRSDTYQEAINMQEYPETNNPGGGLFSGILHKGMHTNVN